MDECSTGAHTCGNNEPCVNSEGTYACDCELGFQWNLNKMRCQGNIVNELTGNIFVEKNNGKVTSSFPMELSATAEKV